MEIGPERPDTVFWMKPGRLAALQHQNVAPVFHLGMDDDNYFYAMEFVDGQAIDKYMKQKGTLTALEALDILPIVDSYFISPSSNLF